MTRGSGDADPLERSRDQRERMIETQIIARGVHDRRVLLALRNVPRELFVPDEHVDRAYDDCALPVGPGQTISQPYIVAYMTEQLDPCGAGNVLEIGTGTGYQAAVLAHLAQRVVTVEADPDLSAEAADRIRRLGIQNVECQVGDGSAGWPGGAPFDRILVTAGSPELPRPLVDQLADGGTLLAPVGDHETQTLIRARKTGGRIVRSMLIGCRFVRLVGRYGWPE